jgi:two-component system, NarL family, sensor kinase
VSPRSADDLASALARLPLLLECDRQGQVVWLSDYARVVLPAHANLFEVLESRIPESGFPLRLFQIMKSPEGLLLGADTADWPPKTEAQRGAGLRWLEHRLLAHYFRLQTIERALSARAARKQRGGGRVAMRQIELERRRVGRELHTGVGQMLAAIRLHLEIMTAQLPEAPPPVRQAVEHIAALASGAFDQVRSISRRLHPPAWQLLNIETALRQLWELSGIPLKFNASLALQTLDREPDPEVKALIYRTAQEGLSNIIEHSQAKSVDLSLEQREDLIVLVLKDDGVGFDSAALARKPASVAGGIGLRSIAEQAAALGAKADVASGPKGTTLVLTAHFSAE